MRNDSLKKRYFYKLFANFITFGASFFTQMIIPRGLGPQLYGDYNFLTNFFSQVVSFGDMGTSTCFYTKLSRRPNEKSLVSFYFYIVTVISLAILIFAVVITVSSAHGVLLPDQKFVYIYFAVGLCILMWISQILNNMVDSFGVTVPAEKTKMVQRVLALIVIVVIFIFNWLNLTSLFWYQYAVYLSLGAAFIWIMRRHNYLLKLKFVLPVRKILYYLRDFYNYTHPLFMYFLVGVIVNTLDRWLLQIFGGSFEQGFYSLAFQVGAICIMFTGAMTPLFTREISIAFKKKDTVQMSKLFSRYVPILVSITAYFSCFVAVETEKIIYITGGEKYKAAALATAIMAFYPIYQTYGQLSSSFFLASDQTKLYRNMGIFFLIAGLPLTYFLIAPRSMFGLNAGATGLAIKMVAIQFVGVNCMLYLNAKFLKISFWKYFVHQITNIVFFLFLAFFASFVIDRIVLPQGINFLKLLFAGMVYTVMVIICGYFLPLMYGLNKSDIRNFINKISPVNLTKNAQS